MKKYFILASIYIFVIFLTYALYICFSYLVVPFQKSPYNIVLNTHKFNGYWKFIPGIYTNEKYNISYTINSHGFRNKELGKSKKKFRIIAIGESSTMGIESNDLATWPSRLEKHLSDLGFIAEVINCGVGGSAIYNHLNMIKAEIIKYKPDAILYYAGRNDHAIMNWERYPGPDFYTGGYVSFFKIWGIYKKTQLRFILLKLFGSSGFVVHKFNSISVL